MTELPLLAKANLLLLRRRRLAEAKLLVGLLLLLLLLLLLPLLVGHRCCGLLLLVGRCCCCLVLGCQLLQVLLMWCGIEARNRAHHALPGQRFLLQAQRGRRGEQQRR